MRDKRYTDLDTKRETMYAKKLVLLIGMRLESAT